MMTLQEYGIEIKQANIFHWQGLCKLSVEAKDNKDKCQEEEKEEYNSEKDSSDESGWQNEAQMYEK